MSFHSDPVCSQTTCTVDWGDGEVYVDDPAPLKANDTINVYRFEHNNYSQIGMEYLVSARCNTSTDEGLYWFFSQ